MSKSFLDEVLDAFREPEVVEEEPEPEPEPDSKPKPPAPKVLYYVRIWLEGIGDTIDLTFNDENERTLLLQQIGNSYWVRRDGYSFRGHSVVMTRVWERELAREAYY